MPKVDVLMWSWFICSFRNVFDFIILELHDEVFLLLKRLKSFAAQRFYIITKFLEVNVLHANLLASYKNVPLLYKKFLCLLYH